MAILTWVLSALLVLLPGTGPGRQPVTLQQAPLGVGGFMSPNLRYLGTIPIDAPGVGARFMEVRGHKRLYMTGVPGMTIYDVTNPAAPMVLGHLQLPNWENEDVSVSKDGNTVLISEYTGTYMHVIDTTNVALPLPVGFLPFFAGHTVECVDDPCNWVYGSEGSIIDLRDKHNPKQLEQGWATQLGLPENGHNIERDAAGILWSDTKPIAAIDASDPPHPKLIASGRAPEDAQVAYQHNNFRPRAKEYKPRGKDEDLGGPLRPGELLLSNGEDNFSPQCHGGSGPFATYSVAGFERGGKDKVRLLDVLRPVSGAYPEGDALINAIGCSGHWFTWNAKHDLVAAAWYEHGTRLLKADPKTGKISQVGFFQPVVGSASAAHWVDDHTIYVVDYMRGIDILRYDEKGPLPTTAQIDASWLAKLGVHNAVADAERYLCRLAVER